MNKLSITTKITLWFSVFLIIIVLITYMVVFLASDQIIKKTIRDNLIEVVSNNYDEIEYISDITTATDVDYYLEYNSGYIEIDDDFLDEVNDVYTGLYSEDGTLIYGENIIMTETSSLDLSNASIQKLTVNGTLYYVFDLKLDTEGLDGLWLRGVVSEEQGAVQINTISKISLIALPLIVIFAIYGGYFIAKRTLKPISEINKKVKEISESGDLKRRLEVKKSNDELKVLEENFNGMLDRIAELFQTEREITMDASHELRTPVAVILSQVELLLESDKLTKEEREDIEVIKKQTLKMKNLINDMLEFSRMESKVVKKRLNLSNLVRDICIDMKKINTKDIELIPEITTNIYYQGNKDYLERMVINLVSNAYKYSKDKGHIWVSLKEDNKQIILTVADDGIGIERNKQKHIFAKFYQIDDARSKDGSGLGLAMVKEIVSIHEGSIEVESTLNKGSKFIVKFRKN